MLVSVDAEMPATYPMILLLEILQKFGPLVLVVLQGFLHALVEKRHLGLPLLIVAQAVLKQVLARFDKFGLVCKVGVKESSCLKKQKRLPTHWQRESKF